MLQLGQSVKLFTESSVLFTVFRKYHAVDKNLDLAGDKDVAVARVRRRRPRQKLPATCQSVTEVASPG